jgi:hypothetical protein
MLTISKNLVWPRDLESFKGGNFNTLSLSFATTRNRVANDYVRGKKKQKENKNKQTKRKQTNKK